MSAPDTINHLISEIARFSFSQSHPILEKYGLYPGQPRLLLCLYHENGVSQGTLAEKLQVKASTITMAIKRLERGGLLRKACDTEDKRVCRIFLTDKGYSVCRELKLIHDSQEALYTENFRIEEKIILKRLLMQVRQNLIDAELKGDE